MSHYIQDTLQINEEVLIVPKLHWAVYIDAYFQLSLLYIIFCHFMNSFIGHGFDFHRFFELSEKIIGLLIFLRIIYLFVRNYSIEMAITNYRVVYKIGILDVRTEELVNSRIEAVIVQQSIMGRLLNYGNILFSGTGTSKLVFKKVYAPWWIKSQAEDTIRQSLMQFNETPYTSYDRFNRRGY